MSGLIGKKIGMTSIYDANGKNQSCTVIQAGPCIVTQVKTAEKDGYNSVQLGFDDKREKSTNSAEKGHFKKANTAVKKKLAEFKYFEKELKEGDIVDTTIFSEGEFVDVVGTSKGKGFQGVVKRHGFGGIGSQTHGQHDRERAPGSLGNSSDAARVMKGMRMAGRTGGARVKTVNLQVLKILPGKNLLLIKGAIPGPAGSYVLLEK